MDYFALILGIIAGLTLAMGAFYLFVGLRRTENKELNLSFALFALFYGSATLAAAYNYSAATVEEYITASRIIGPFVALAWIALIWFVSYYTQFRPKWLLLVLSAAFVAAGLANTFGEYSIFEEITGLTFLTLPWGEQLAIAESIEGSWFAVFLMAQLISIGYILAACVIQFRRGAHRAAAVLGMGLFWFVFTIVIDNLVDTGIIDFIFLSDFGFLLLAIMMSFEMANEVIRTEEELAKYQTNLENMVAERAVDLEKAQQQLIQQSQEQAAVEERSRLARDLHDAVTQTLYSAALIAEALPSVWDREPEEGRRSLIKLRQLVRGALAEMRTLLFELRPESLMAADLDILVTQLSDAFTGRTRIPVDVRADTATDIPADVKVAVYRITQETFNNIDKHGRANQVVLSLHQEKDGIQLKIQDNGQGFDIDQLATKGMGLAIMRERAEEIGAEIDIQTQMGLGTTVGFTWENP